MKDLKCGGNLLVSRKLSKSFLVEVSAMKSRILFLFICLLGTTVFATDYNDTSGSMPPPPAANGTSLSFDPNDYDFLVYDCGNQRIQLALDKLDISYDVRNGSNSVTSQDLSNYDILIVGWKPDENSDTSGLDPDIIEDGIIGRVILTGHDTDWHTAENRSEQPYAERFLAQCIGYILNGSGTGLLAHGEPYQGYDWLPDSWAIEVTDGIAEEEVSELTSTGINSGIFDNLTKEDMSDWKNSFHNTFEQFNIGFTPFEMGIVDDANSVITIAASVSPQGIDFEKGYDTENGITRSPGDEIVYTISWDNTSNETLSDVWIIDYFPRGVIYPEGFEQIDPNDPFNPIPADLAYDPNSHTYIYEVGTLYPNDSGYIELVTQVNYEAEPGIKIENIAELWTGDALLSKATVKTPIDCWDTIDPNIIYVDESATGFNNGTDWTNAYSGSEGLENALLRAENSTCSSPYIICVAQGTYSPGKYYASSFVLPDYTSVYGGFVSEGSDRNPDIYKTILTGAIDPNTINDNVVTMGDETLLDGFIVTDAKEYGVYGDGVDFEIENCQIINSQMYGFYLEDCNIILQNSIVKNHKEHGVYHSGNSYTILVENCDIYNNKRHGLFTVHSVPIIKNSVIRGNGYDQSGYEGINILVPAYSPILYNNTVVFNQKAGIAFVANDPNGYDYPDIQNCILYYNNSEGDQISGLNPDDVAQYCCIQDCNEVNYNFNDEPGFAYSVNTSDIFDPNNNYHLAWNSPCKDTGNPLFDSDDVGLYDIDFEDRIINSQIDRGADEIYSCNGYSNDDLYNSLDWNADGLVNLEEFYYFSNAWKSHDPNDPAVNDPNYAMYEDYNDPNSIYYVSESALQKWYPKCNLDNTGDSQYQIDLDDFDLFLDNWLWIACWKESQMSRFDILMAVMSGGSESMMMAVPMLETMSIESTAIEPESTAEMSSSSLSEVLEIIEYEIDMGHENLEGLLEIKDFLEDCLKDLKTKK